MNNLDRQYQSLLKDILENGHVKKDRTGTGTKSVFGRTIRHKMSEGFPLLTTKKMYFKGIVTELLWFLRGETNIQSLIKNNCHIWDGDAYKKYLKDLDRPNVREDDPDYILLSKEEFIEKIKTDNEFAWKWGDLGPIYGKQWRSWYSVAWNDEHRQTKDSVHNHYDQIANAINLLKKDPDNRRNRVSAWNVGEIDQMTLPPCHTDFQFYTRELTPGERFNIQTKVNDYQSAYTGEEFDKNNIPKRAISLMWNQRSVDTFLGLPFNIASYGLLLCIVAEIVNMVPEDLIGNLGDTHLYLNHLDQAKEQIGEELSLQERIDWWFHNNKPNRDMVDYFDDLPDGGKEIYLNKVGVPKTTREPRELPSLIINTEFWEPGTEDGCGMGPGTYTSNIDSLIKGMQIEDFQIANYNPHSKIEAPLSN